MGNTADSPDFLGQLTPPHLILSVIFVGAGLFFLYLLGQQITLICTRTGAMEQCTLHTSWMNLVQLNNRTIEGIRSAWVEDQCDEDGCAYRVVMRTDQGEIPLGQAFSSGKASKQRKAEQINAFASQQSHALKVSEGGGGWILIPLVFVIIGIGLIYHPLWATLQAAFRRQS